MQTAAVNLSAPRGKLDKSKRDIFESTNNLTMAPRSKKVVKPVEDVTVHPPAAVIHPMPGPKEMCGHCGRRAPRIRQPPKPKVVGEPTD